MTLASNRVTHRYKLIDSASDAEATHECSQQLHHIPITAPHPRRGTKKLPKVFPGDPAPELPLAQQQRFKERTMVERVNATIERPVSTSQLRVRGAAKVIAHLMSGVPALTVDQSSRMRRSEKKPQ
ncbi:MAG: hypothetical protein JNM66_14720 [Bryobacterales bacterium]|nr:hypothetical protein [Bryobacterales bacterium]